jgi:hypothetical protein
LRRIPLRQEVELAIADILRESGKSFQVDDELHKASQTAIRSSRMLLAKDAVKADCSDQHSCESLNDYDVWGLWRDRLLALLAETSKPAQEEQDGPCRG